ncbi:MAG: serine/threonine-protein kinase [Bryobacteraceae bacterium]
MQVGDRIGDYEIVKVIGAGGMGQVFQVRNTLSERVEAMKVALSNLEGNQEALARFQREIKLQAALDHPNIAKLYTAMSYGNQLLMFMEFVTGDSLSKMAENGPLPVKSVLDWATQALDALGYAHGKGVVHRDIKPANIMVTQEGVVKLMDFGIARAKSDRKLTQTGSAVGSLYYMSPEQIKGTEPDPRSDLYSFGITLYELVTGKRPFAGNSDFQIMSAHLQESPAPPIDVVPGVPTDLSDIILMAIAKDPESRFQSAQAFRAALANVQPGAASTAVGPAATATTKAASDDATVVMAPRPQAVKPSDAPTVVAARPATPPQPAPVQQQRPPQSPLQPPPMAQQPAAMSSPMPAAQAMPAPPPASRRGMYMAIGGVATLVVIALAVTQGPKMFNSGSTDAQTQVPATTSAPAPSATPAAQQATPAPAAVATPAPAPAPAAVPTPAPAAKQVTPTPTARPAVAAIPQAIPQTSPQQAARPAQAAPQATPPPPQPVASQPPAQPVPAPAAQPAPARAAAPSPELNELRERYNLVSIRASTAKAGIESMQQQMSRQGLNLRADIREANTRMDYMLQESMASIRAGDVDGGKRNIQMAERALEQVEKFLGR